MATTTDYIGYFFSSIEESFQQIFDSIPHSAQPYLISIVIYATMALLLFEAYRNGIRWWLVWLGFGVMAVLFSIWRLSILDELPDVFSWDTISELCLLIFSTVFIALLAVAFYKKNPWLKKAILIFIWALFTLFTWIIAPAAGEMELSYSTLKQYLLVAALFAIPYVAALIERQRRAMNTK